MRLRRKLLFVSLTGAALFMALMLAVVLISHLMANRDVVKAFITTKAAQATGGDLSYDRLQVAFFPLPHLEASNIRLERPDRFDIKAQVLSVFPRILPLLKGVVSFRQVALTAPAIEVHIDRAGTAPEDRPAGNAQGSLRSRIESIVDSIFSSLATVDPETTLQISEGRLSLALDDAPGIRISGIDAQAAHEGNIVSLILDCRSTLTGQVMINANADISTRRAKGRIDIADMNLRPLLLNLGLPGGITVSDTRTAVEATLSVDGPETLQSRFALNFPSLTVKRATRKLTLQTVAVTGSLGYADNRLTLSIDELQCAQPSLALSAKAEMTPTETAGRSTLRLEAAAKQLDVSVAGRVTRAIAGDLEEIETAFSVARKGLLTDAVYAVDFNIDPNGWHQTAMQASGHLSKALVTIPGIDADLEDMDGEVHYRDQRVDFSKVSGHFKGVDFDGLDATIDWEHEASLSIASSAAHVDAATLHAWLLSFQGMAPVNDYITSLEGTLRLTKLDIDGPLTKPADWKFKITGTPQDVRLSSPLLPFVVGFTGGEVTYGPDGEEATGVSLTFLDASLVNDYRSTSIFDPEALTVHLDGALGPEAVAWLSTILPIPAQLKLNPPVELSGIAIDWSNKKTLDLTGNMKTAGGVDLVADLSVTPGSWRVRRLQFSDGSSNATVSFMSGPSEIMLDFDGNIEKSTVDGLLDNNRTLSGRLQGNFNARIDLQELVNSSFNGKLSGTGLHFHSLLAETMDVNHLSVKGSGDRLMIEPTELSLCGSRLIVDGEVAKDADNLALDLDVDADRVDEELVHLLGSVGHGGSKTAGKTENEPPVGLRGTVHLSTTDLSYGGFDWSPVDADIRLDGESIAIRVNHADLCGISTPGNMVFSSKGISLHISPNVADGSVQETTECLLSKPVKAEARYSLQAELKLPATHQDPARSITGSMEFSSENGKVYYYSVLMKIFSVLNITEVFTGGKSDLAEKGYSYSRAHTAAEIGGGKMRFSEILIDGNSLKITGQGSIDLVDRTVDITLLAAPLKTIDRIVNKIPVINYIAGGSLISIPLHVEGKMDNVKVAPMEPAAVGRGLLDLMGRTLKAPFKLVEGATSGERRLMDTRQKGP